MQITEHFSLEELINTSHEEFLAENKDFAEKNIDKLRKLCGDILEPARKLIGPIKISSCVRCPGLNKAVGGVTTSQHCKCEAADCLPMKMSVEDAFEILSNSDIKFGQLILEVVGTRNWLHISLGYPYRDPSKCGEKLFYNGKKYVKIP